MLHFAFTASDCPSLSASEDGSRDRSLPATEAPLSSLPSRTQMFTGEREAKSFAKNILISFEEDKFVNCTTVFISSFGGNVI